MNKDVLLGIIIGDIAGSRFELVDKAISKIFDMRYIKAPTFMQMQLSEVGCCLKEEQKYL